MFNVWGYLVANLILLVIDVNRNKRDYEFIVMWLLISILVMIPLAISNL